jgi:hypothetical protein
MSRFPHLYECSVCEKPVKVTPKGEGYEPEIKWSCGHDGTTVWANRKVTLYGKGDVNIGTKITRKVTLTMRQLLSAIFKRSI